MRVLGAVLAGGRSRRFGSDKALAEWRGRPLVDHVAAALVPHVERVVICGRDLPDRPGPGLGPLGGINAALAHAAVHGFDRVLVAPCDTPLLDERLLTRLAAADGPAFLADLPVIGIWSAALVAHLDEWLATSDDHSVRTWAKAAGAEPLRIPPCELPINVNRPANLTDLDQSLQP